MLVDVLDEGLYEWCTDLLNSLLQPDIVVKELSLPSQDAQIYGKVKVAAVNDLYEAVLNLLGELEHSREVKDTLLVPAALSDAANHKVLIDVPELFEHDIRLLVG